MRRTAMLILSLALAGLGGCAGDDTAYAVFNHTDRPIAVTYAQSPENAEATAISVDQRVLPEQSVRFMGKKGDRLTVVAGEEAPLTLEYTWKSHVLSVTSSGAGVNYDLRPGYSDPHKKK